jgi:hypothetical protein
VAVPVAGSANDAAREANLLRIASADVEAERLGLKGGAPAQSDARAGALHTYGRDSHSRGRLLKDEIIEVDLSAGTVRLTAELDLEFERRPRGIDRLDRSRQGDQLPVAVGDW